MIEFIINALNVIQIKIENSICHIDRTQASGLQLRPIGSVQLLSRLGKIIMLEGSKAAGPLGKFEGIVSTETHTFIFVYTQHSLYTYIQIWVIITFRTTLTLDLKTMIFSCFRQFKDTFLQYYGISVGNQLFMRYIHFMYNTNMLSQPVPKLHHITQNTPKKENCFFLYFRQF